MDLNSQFEKVKNASRSLVPLGEVQINTTLLNLADHLIKSTDRILEANAKDCERMDPDDPKYDRLLLTKTRINSIATEMQNIAHLPSPLGELLEEKEMKNGLQIKKIRVPLGVIGIIYEARPNVTFDVFSLCFKSGNACILKGGSDAKETNQVAVELIHEVIEKMDLNQDIIFLMPPEREHVKALLEAKKYVDIIIPRGSQSLINFVTENSKVPVIETGAGIVHTYFDETADTAAAKQIIFNAKCRRPSVCNALDCLLIHEERLKDLPELTKELSKNNVEIFADEKSFTALNGKYTNLQKASDKHFGTEFLSHKLSIKSVENLDEALTHIQKYSSKHSEAILSKTPENIRRFLNEVDAAAVYANTSTAFTDGAEFGLGAEIGISTQKLHARGPMALRELTSYKWLIQGTGQIRD